jgi:hypothetical protein
LHPRTASFPLKRKYSITDIAEEYAGAINASVIVNARQQVEITGRMARILLNALEVFKDEHRSNSYLINFLDNKKTRERHFKDIIKTDFWITYDENHKEGIDLRQSGRSITDRLTIFDKNEYVKAFIEGDDEFNIEEIVKNKSIVCFNLEHVPKNARHYIGNLITYAIRTYINRSNLADSNLGVYVDEFHSFINETFDDALVSCLKRGVNFVLAHQNHAQVLGATVETALSNSQVVVALDVGEVEAKKMAYKYKGLKAQDILDIEKHHAYISINKSPYYVETYHIPVKPYIHLEKPYTPRSKVNFFRSGIINIGKTVQELSAQ